MARESRAHFRNNTAGPASTGQKLLRAPFFFFSPRTLSRTGGRKGARGSKGKKWYKKGGGGGISPQPFNRSRARPDHSLSMAHCSTDHKRLRVDDISLPSETKPALSISVARVDGDLLCAVRAALQKSILVPALSDITISQNTSNLHDEIIAHRIGLIPVRLQGCSPGAVGRFRTGPVLRDAIVRARDVVCEGFSFAAADEVIAFLNRGESLAFEGKLSWGTGKEHARYAPVCAARVVPRPVINVNIRLRARHTKEEVARVVASCPRGVFSANLDVEDAHRCNFCGECSRVLDDRTVTVKPSVDEFELCFESVGNAPAAFLLDQAIRAVRDKVQGLRDSLMA